MKRAASFYLFLFANLVIWAHAVVPHRHHSRIFVSVARLVDSDLLELLNHPHDGDVGKFCPIVTGENDALPAFLSNSEHSLNGFAVADDSHAAINNLPPDGMPFVFKPFVAGGCFHCFTRHIKLRAPPVC